MRVCVCVCLTVRVSKCFHGETVSFVCACVTRRWLMCACACSPVVCQRQTHNCNNHRQQRRPASSIHESPLRRQRLSVICAWCSALHRAAHQTSALLLDGRRPVAIEWPKAHKRAARYLASPAGWCAASKPPLAPLTFGRRGSLAGERASEQVLSLGSYCSPACLPNALALELKRH